MHWLTELQDKSILTQILELKEQQKSSFELNREQKKELDGRLERYENGEMEFSAWDKVEGMIRSRAEDAL